MNVTETQTQYTLDPANWEDFKNLGHRMIDDMVAHLSGLGSRPAWQEMPLQTRLDLKELPRLGQGAEERLL